MMNALRWLVFVVAALLMNFPVIATLITSLKSAAEISMNPGFMIQALTLDNYRVVFSVSERLDIYAYLFNSFVAAGIGAGLAIVLSFPAAYAIARHNVGQAVLLPVILNLRAMPLVIFAIPLYMMFQALGLLDTQLGLGLILTVVNLPLTLVVLVNGIRDIPSEIDEAARMDRASLWSILTKVILPLSRASIAATFIFGFITAWNEFLFGLMLTTREAVPVTVGASFFFSAGGGGVQWGVAAAVMIVAGLPPMVLGVFMYRQLVGSVAAGAVKG